MPTLVSGVLLLPLRYYANSDTGCLFTTEPEVTAKSDNGYLFTTENDINGNSDTGWLFTVDTEVNADLTLCACLLLILRQMPIWNSVLVYC